MHDRNLSPLQEIIGQKNQLANNYIQIKNIANLCSLATFSFIKGFTNLYLSTKILNFKHQLLEKNQYLTYRWFCYMQFKREIINAKVATYIYIKDNYFTGTNGFLTHVQEQNITLHVRKQRQTMCYRNKKEFYSRNYQFQYCEMFIQGLCYYKYLVHCHVRQRSFECCSLRV